MSKTLSDQEANLASSIAHVAYRVHVQSETRPIARARRLAEDLATEVAVVAMMTVGQRVAFVGAAGKEAATLVRRFM